MPCSEVKANLDLSLPPPDVMEYARQKCGEDPNTKLQAIDELRDMIYERGECTPHRMDDDYLTRFLRARHFVPQRAHRLLVNYYKFKKEHPELFDNVYPLDLHKVGENKIIAVPPYLDQHGRRLMLYRLGCWDPNTIPLDDILRATVFTLELALVEQRMQILGGVALFDLEDLSTQHMWQITPSVAAVIVKLLVTSFPSSTHAIHIINHSWIFDKIYSMFKPFLTLDMKSRIFFHGYELASLHKHIHPDHLPERYGGIWPDYPHTIWIEALKDNTPVAKELLASGYKFREEQVGPNVLKYLKEAGVQLS